MTSAVAYRGRFAPSPTGPLHFGSLLAALGSWLDARSAGGEWLLRIEDVDAPRCVPGAGDAILRMLDALGLHWDGEVVWQSRRGEAYAAALAALRERGDVYPCVCSRKAVEAAARSRGAPTGPLTQLTQRLTQLMQVVDDADRLPTASVRAAAERLLREVDALR